MTAVWNIIPAKRLVDQPLHEPEEREAKVREQSSVSLKLVSGRSFLCVVKLINLGQEQRTRESLFENTAKKAVRQLPLQG